MPGESTPVVTVTSPGRTISLIKEKEMWGRRRGAVKDWMHAHHDASVPTDKFLTISFFLMTRTNFGLPLRGAFNAVLVMEKEIV